MFTPACWAHLDAITHNFTALIHALISIFMGRCGTPLLPSLTTLVPSLKIVVTFHCPGCCIGKMECLCQGGLSIREWCACHFAHHCHCRFWCTILFKEISLIRVACITHPLSHPLIFLPSKGCVRMDSSWGYFWLWHVLFRTSEIHTLIEAYAIARPSGARDAAHLPLVLVGGYAGGTRPIFNTSGVLVAQTPGVHLLGERCGEALEKYRRMPWLCFPTSSEGLAFTMLEGCQFLSAIYRD